MKSKKREGRDKGNDVGAGGIKGKFRRPTVKISKPKTRKELRKQSRKTKKAKKHEFLMKKFNKMGSETDAKGTKNNNKEQGQNNKKKNKVPVDKRKKMELEFRESEAQLKKEMEDVRRKRLLEDNIEEDRTISQLEKKLKLNKKAIVPASFRTDGLDYLLEVCSKKKEKVPKKSGKSNEDAESNDDDDNEDDEDDLQSNDDESNDDFDDDFDEDSNENFSSEEEVEQVTQSKAKQKQPSKKRKISVSEEEDDDFGSDFEENSDEVLNEDEEGVGDDEDLASDHDSETKTVQKSEPKEKFWEDIYGRLRTKDGAVVDEKALKQDAVPTGGKYVPPGKRGNQSARDKIVKTIKGLLNRLAESNIHGISQQVEELYMTNSRNEMNETMLDQYYLSLVTTVAMSERIILEHIMLITILHANVGSEIGAFFVQNSIQKFRKLYDDTLNLEETKELSNLALIISSLYHFKIIGCGLIFDVLNFLADSFKAKDIELILIILKSIGFRLRKDDPISLKNLVLRLQQQATSTSEQLIDSRVKFMLDILLAIKNNNMTKIPNYDPSYGEHLLKMLKQHFHKGNYVVELKVSMQDLLNADTKGRWWVVGSAWSSDKDASESTAKESNTLSSMVSSKVKAKLLAKAKRFGMNTDIRKNIFCIIMTAEDYLDAFEKLMHLGLKNQQEREIIHVIVYCCLHENKYNPYYVLILSKLCSVDRRFMLTLQYNLWDRLKDLPGLTSQQLQNMSHLVTDLVNEKSLPISILKIVEFGDMKKEKLKFLKDTLSGILLQQNVENIEEIFTKIALSEKLYVFRESLRLFMGHFMLKPTVTLEGEEITTNLDPRTLQLLEERLKLADKAMDLGRGRVQL